MSEPAIPVTDPGPVNKCPTLFSIHSSANKLTADISSSHLVSNEYLDHIRLFHSSFSTFFRYSPTLLRLGYP